MALDLTDGDLPALHDAASTSSTAAQATYLWLILADLAALVAGAFLTAISIHKQPTLQWVAATGALLLVVGLIITAVISRNNYEQRWYGGRAVAESVKTLSWRYAVAADPFSCAVPAKDADSEFVSQLRAILEQGEFLAVELGGDSGTKDQISAAMRSLRAGTLAERKAAYARGRVAQQRAWYSGKAATNAARERALFRAVIASQFASVAAAIYLTVRPTSVINLSGVSATLAASFLAWLQVKRHQELAQSYGVAAHELGLIAEQVHHIEGEAEFAQFVGDAESAVSREHTLWVARRDIPNIKRRT